MLSRQTQLANPIVPVQWANRKDLCQERRVQNDLRVGGHLCRETTSSHCKLSSAERRNGQRQNLVGEDGSMMASQREKARGNNSISCGFVWQQQRRQSRAKATVQTAVAQLRVIATWLRHLISNSAGRRLSFRGLDLKATQHQHQHRHFSTKIRWLFYISYHLKTTSLPLETPWDSTGAPRDPWWRPRATG